MGYAQRQHRGEGGQEVTFRGLTFHQQFIFQNYFLLSLNIKEMDDIISILIMVFEIF